MIVLYHGRVAGVRRKKAHRIVPPVIVQLHAIHHAGALHLIELKNREKLDRVDAQILQVRNLLAQSLERAACRHPGRGIPGESSYMCLIYNQILRRNLRKRHFPPVKIILHHTGVIHKTLATLRTLAPVPLPCHRLRKRIQQHIVLVKQQPPGHIIRSVQLKRIFKFINLQAEYQHCERVANVICLRILQSGIWLFFLRPEQQKRTSRRTDRMNRKAHSPRRRHCTFRIVKSRAHHKTVNLIQWREHDSPILSVA